MFTFLHTADIHLDSPLLKIAHYEGAPVESLRGATRRAFENLVMLAVSKSVDFILISGDLYDGDWKDYNTGLYFVSQMSKLREAGIPVYIITGNHDAASKMTKNLRLPDNVHLFSTDAPDTILLDNINVAIHGQGFSSPAVKKDLSGGYPSPVLGYFNIGMLHTCATGREGHESYAPCTLEGLYAKGYDYWALGHVHQREILSDEPFIVFPGNIQGRHIREIGAKGCMEVTVDDDKRTAAEFQPLDVIRWCLCETDVSEARNGYDVVEKIREQLETLLEENEGIALIARIQISGTSSAHEELASDSERWINEIRSTALDLSGSRIWVEKVGIHTTFQQDMITSADGPVGEILQFFDDVQSDPIRLELLGGSLNDLWKKLPREFKEISEFVSPAYTQWLADMLEHVKPMLLRRLCEKSDFFKKSDF